jgi:hypothetical protein
MLQASQPPARLPLGPVAIKPQLSVEPIKKKINPELAELLALKEEEELRLLNEQHRSTILAKELKYNENTLWLQASS